MEQQLLAACFTDNKLKVTKGPHRACGRGQLVLSSSSETC